jgi:hypothetical protein
MIAHNPFQPDESKKGVQFLAVKARGKFEYPKEVWLDENFRREGAQIDHYRSLLESLETRFRAHPLSQQNSTAAMYRPFFGVDYDEPFYMPIPRPMSPALWNYLNRQAQAPPDSDPSTSETDSQTPETPHE